MSEAFTPDLYDDFQLSMISDAPPPNFAVFEKFLGSTMSKMDEKLAPLLAGISPVEATEDAVGVELVRKIDLADLIPSYRALHQNKAKDTFTPLHTLSPASTTGFSAKDVFEPKGIHLNQHLPSVESVILEPTRPAAVEKIVMDADTTIPIEQPITAGPAKDAIIPDTATKAPSDDTKPTASGPVNLEERFAERQKKVSDMISGKSDSSISSEAI